MAKQHNIMDNKRSMQQKIMVCNIIIILTQGSWKQKLIDRLYNVEKKRKRVSLPDGEEPPTQKERSEFNQRVCGNLTTQKF